MPARTPVAVRADARAAVFAASALLHLAGLILLATYLSRTPTYADSPTIQVTLVRPTPPPAVDARAETAPSPPARVRQPTAAAPPTDMPPAPALDPRGEPAGDTAAVNGQRALRGLAGCGNPSRLSREERERCETRRWAGAGPGPARINLDPTGRYVEETEPYLVRKPKNGCKVRATGDVGPMGDTAHVRAGIGCAFAF